MSQSCFCRKESELDKISRVRSAGNCFLRLHHGFNNSARLCLNYGGGQIPVRGLQRHSKAASCNSRYDTGVVILSQTGYR